MDVSAVMASMATPHFWVAVVQIIWINILLSGDNAVVIALACREDPLDAKAVARTGNRRRMLLHVCYSLMKGYVESR